LIKKTTIIITATINIKIPRPIQTGDKTHIHDQCIIFPNLSITKAIVIPITKLIIVDMDILYINTLYLII
jgi:hypothetical protein